MKKDVLIVGTGGCAAELTYYIEDNNANSSEDEQINVLGYIDYQENIDKYWKKYNFDKPVICNIDEYIAKPNEEVLVAIMNVKFREEMIQKLLHKKANIGSFIHRTVLVSKSSKMGIGNIFYPYCIAEPNSVIGDFNLLTSQSIISHDCVVGNNNFFSTAGIAGSVTVGNNNYFGIRSNVIPGVVIGNNNTIQAGMVVDRNIANDSTIFYRFKEKILAIPKK